MIGPFSGDYRWLSNFSSHPIQYGSATFLTVEHYYQAAKAQHTADFWEIAQAATPGQAKRLGRKCAQLPGFEENKRGVMLIGVTLKFVQHRDLRDKLAATGTEELVEVNTWGDRYWGAEMLWSVPEGENWLGRILMKVREVQA